MVSSQCCLLWMKDLCLKNGFISFCPRFLSQNPRLSYPSAFCGHSLSSHICRPPSSRMAGIDGCHYPDRESCCAMCRLFSPNDIFFSHQPYERKDRAVRHSERHLHKLLSALQNHFLHIAPGARGLLYVKMRRKGQRTLINFTWHPHLRRTCLTFTPPCLVTAPPKRPG